MKRANSGRSAACRATALALAASALVVASGVLSGGGSPAQAAGTVERVSGTYDFADPWSSTGFPVPTTPTPPGDARYTVYATKVALGPSGDVFVRDYDTIVRVDPSTGETQRVAGFYEAPNPLSPYPVVPAGIGDDSLTVGTGWSRNLVVLSDGRMLFDDDFNDETRSAQVFSAPVGGGAIGLFAGNGSAGPPTQGAQAASTSLDAVNGLFATTSDAVWIVGDYDAFFTQRSIHRVAPDGTITTYSLPAVAEPLAVDGEVLIAPGVDPTTETATLYRVDADGVVTATPVTGDCETADPIVGEGSASRAKDARVTYRAELTVPPYPVVSCSVDLASGASFIETIDPEFDAWLSGGFDGAGERALSPAVWDPATETWWFTGQTSDSATGAYSIDVYRHDEVLDGAPPTIARSRVPSRNFQSGAMVGSLYQGFFGLTDLTEVVVDRHLSDYFAATGASEGTLTIKCDVVRPNGSVVQRSYNNQVTPGTTPRTIVWGPNRQCDRVVSVFFRAFPGDLDGDGNMTTSFGSLDQDDMDLALANLASPGYRPMTVHITYAV